MTARLTNIAVRRTHGGRRYAKDMLDSFPRPAQLGYDLRIGERRQRLVKNRVKQHHTLPHHRQRTLCDQVCTLSS